MACEKFRGDYNQLQQIATTFQRESENVGKTIQTLSSKIGDLQGGKWIGKNADKFYNEWQSDVKPALDRLKNALNTANSITKKVSNKVKEAEEQSSKVFVIVVQI